jgi:hypothetical protein
MLKHHTIYNKNTHQTELLPAGYVCVLDTALLPQVLSTLLPSILGGRGCTYISHLSLNAIVTQPTNLSLDLLLRFYSNIYQLLPIIAAKVLVEKYPLGAISVGCISYIV